MQHNCSRFALIAGETPVLPVIDVAPIYGRVESKLFTIHDLRSFAMCAPECATVTTAVSPKFLDTVAAGNIIGAEILLTRTLVNRTSSPNLSPMFLRYS